MEEQERRKADGRASNYWPRLSLGGDEGARWEESPEGASPPQVVSSGWAVGEPLWVLTRDSARAPPYIAMGLVARSQPLCVQYYDLDGVSLLSSFEAVPAGEEWRVRRRRRISDPPRIAMRFNFKPTFFREVPPELGAMIAAAAAFGRASAPASMDSMGDDDRPSMPTRLFCPHCNHQAGFGSHRTLQRHLAQVHPGLSQKTSSQALARASRRRSTSPSHLARISSFASTSVVVPSSSASTSSSPSSSVPHLPSHPPLLSDVSSAVSVPPVTAVRPAAPVSRLGNASVPPLTDACSPPPPPSGVSGVPSHRCPVCAKSYASVSWLEKHVAKKHHDAPPPALVDAAILASSAAPILPTALTLQWIACARLYPVKRIPKACRLLWADVLSDSLARVCAHTDSPEAWTLLLALPKLCLRTPPRGMRKKVRPAELIPFLTRLLTMAREGQWAALVEEAQRASAEVLGPFGEAAPSTNRTKERVISLVEEGQLSKAVKGLDSEGIHPVPPLIVEALREKHPLGPPLLAAQCVEPPCASPSCKS